MWGIVLIFIASFVYASEPYAWSLKTNKSRVYVNEAVEIEYTCRFKDQGYLYAIEFNPVGENDMYRLLSLGEVEQIKDGKRSATYRYVLFPKKAGEQLFSFKARMRKTNRASIESAVIGRDNVEAYAYKDTEALLPAVKMDVLDQQERMTGRFALSVTLDKQEVKAYEPVHLDVHISGEGNFDQIRPYEIHIDGVKSFSGEGEKNYRLSKEGFKGEWRQQFSLVGEKSFRIEPIELRYFDIDKHESVVLRSEAFEVNVTEGYIRAELLDEEPPKKESLLWSPSTLYYVLTFLFGAVVGRFISQFKRVKKEPHGFEEEVEACTSVKSILTKLVISEDQRYLPLIKKYETLGEKASLRDLKKELKAVWKSDTINIEKGIDAK